MELLSKQEISRRSNLERKAQIDEGVKLARNVDGLREKVAEEQARTSQFREASKKQLHEEIEALISQKNTLMNEVQDLQDQKRVLQIPLDAEWERVNARSSDLDGFHETLQQREIDLGIKESEIEGREHQVKIGRQNLDEERLAADKQLAYASTRFAEVEAADKDLAERERLFDAKVVGKNQDLLAAEAIVLARERDVTNREAQLDADRVALNDRESKLNDREAVLVRNQIRSK